MLDITFYYICYTCDELTELWFLRPTHLTQHKIGQFGDIPQAISLALVWKN